MTKKKNQLAAEIADLINSIKEHSDNIAGKAHIPQLELEVILDKIEKLYKRSIVLNYLSSQSEEENDVKPLTVETSLQQPEVITPPEKTTPEEPNKKAQVVIDLFSEAEPAVNPKVKTESNLSQKFQQTRIDNLKSAIGINEKFQFVNDMFEGSTNEYHAAVDELNAFTDLEEANIYLNNLKDVYKWDMDKPVIRTFMELVKRRFI